MTYRLLLQDPRYNLNMSASLKPGQADKGGRDWLSSIAESSLVLSSIIKVIHPKLFEMGMEAMKPCEVMEICWKCWIYGTPTLMEFKSLATEKRPSTGITSPNRNGMTCWPPWALTMGQFSNCLDWELDSFITAAGHRAKR
jgi:hypothetical protein